MFCSWFLRFLRLQQRGTLEAEIAEVRRHLAESDTSRESVLARNRRLEEEVSNLRRQQQQLMRNKERESIQAPQVCSLMRITHFKYKSRALRIVTARPAPIYVEIGGGGQFPLINSRPIRPPRNRRLGIRLEWSRTGQNTLQFSEKTVHLVYLIQCRSLNYLLFRVFDLSFCCKNFGPRNNIRSFQLKKQWNTQFLHLYTIKLLMQEHCYHEFILGWALSTSSESWYQWRIQGGVPSPRLPRRPWESFFQVKK